jgi:hypothetical protein
VYPAHPFYAAARILLQRKELPTVCAEIANLHVAALTAEVMGADGLQESILAARAYWRRFDREIRLVAPGSLDAAAPRPDLPTPPRYFDAREVGLPAGWGWVVGCAHRSVHLTPPLVPLSRV